LARTFAYATAESVVSRDSSSIPRRGFADLVDDAVADTPPASADSQDDRALLAARHDDVLCAGRAMEEIPLGEPPLLTLHDERALPRENEV
jgi:hypothetical protein